MNKNGHSFEAWAAIAETAIAESLWNVASIISEPDIGLLRWSIRRDTAGASYFVGERADEHSGRVSTRVMVFDPQTRRGVTSSGRIYELIGPPGISADAEYVWRHYKRINRIVEAKTPQGRIN